MDSMTEFQQRKKHKMYYSSSNPKNDGTLVCVVGLDDYVPSRIAKLLLDRGYRVRGTVRYPVHPRMIDHLWKFNDAKERLELVEVNLQEDGSCDNIIKDCEGVFHTTSPFYYGVKDQQIESVDLVINGTLNVLKSCAKSPSVKRVILTSSMDTVTHSGKHKSLKVVVDETWFSNPDYCRQHELWYALSHTLAEEAARKFANDNRMNMVTINVGMEIGPILQPTPHRGANAVLNLINGAESYPNKTVEWIDIKDIANAHIQAFEIPSANGRYCLVESVAHYADVVKLLRGWYPNVKLPKRCINDEPLKEGHVVSKEKARSLGIDFIPLHVSLKETVDSLKENKFVMF